MWKHMSSVCTENKCLILILNLSLKYPSSSLQVSNSSVAFQMFRDVRAPDRIVHLCDLREYSSGMMDVAVSEIKLAR
jgi:hypothetical protein